MPNFNDLTGQRFGKLVCIGVETRAKRATETSPAVETSWRCRCDCGNEKVVRLCNLGYNTNSCGCIRNTQGAHTRKHPLWKTWSGMHQRCNDANCRSYPDYGGRGIAVCERWQSFPNFLEDMEATYFKGASIDRKDVNGNYEPSNCRWATSKEQGRNRRYNVFINTPWGRVTVAEAAERMNIPQRVLRGRIRKGWSEERIFDPQNFRVMTWWDRRPST